jgi:hypothetical protein
MMRGVKQTFSATSARFLSELCGSGFENLFPRAHRENPQRSQREIIFSLVVAANR